MSSYVNQKSKSRPIKQRPVQEEKLIIDKIDKGNGITVYIARNKVPHSAGAKEVIVKGKISVDPLSFFE